MLVPLYRHRKIVDCCFLHCCRNKNNGIKGATSEQKPWSGRDNPGGAETNKGSSRIERAGRDVVGPPSPAMVAVATMAGDGGPTTSPPARSILLLPLLVLAPPGLSLPDCGCCSAIAPLIPLSLFRRQYKKQQPTILLQQQYRDTKHNNQQACWSLSSA